VITQKDYQPKPMPIQYIPEAVDNEFRELSRIHRQIVQDLMSGKSGTLVLDDGANWRVTLQFKEGKLIDVTTAASSGAAASWTDS